jgi:hypothetical protein
MTSASALLISPEDTEALQSQQQCALAQECKAFLLAAKSSAQP